MGNNLKKYYDIRYVPESSVSNTTVIVDGSIWLNQSLSVYRTSSGEYLTSKSGTITSHLYGIFNKLVPLICRGNTIVFCIDGKRLDEKMAVALKRQTHHEKQVMFLENLRKSNLITREQILRAAKRVIKVTKSMIDSLTRMLDLMGVTLVTSKYEAESQCVFVQRELALAGISSYIVSADTDTVVFGGENVIMSQTSGNEYVVSGLTQTLRKMNVTHRQLIDVVLLSGGDYSPGLWGTGPVNAIKLVTKYGGLEGVPDSEIKLSCKTSWEILRSNYERFHDLYARPEVNTNFKISASSIDFQELEHFLIEELNFSRRMLIVLADYYARLT